MISNYYRVTFSPECMIKSKDNGLIICWNWYLRGSGVDLFFSSDGHALKFDGQSISIIVFTILKKIINCDFNTFLHDYIIF